MNIVFSKETEKYAKMQNSGNLNCYEESEILDLICEKIKDKEPRNVLELGSGIGRGTLYIYKKIGWENTHFYLLDSNGEKIKGGISNSKKNFFYNSTKAAKLFCKDNGLKKFTVIDIEKEEMPDVKFDIVFSVISIGFHWSVDKYLDKLVDKLHKDSLLLFQTRSIYNKNKKTANWAQSEIRKIKEHNSYEFINYQGGKDKEIDRYLLIFKKK